MLKQKAADRRVPAWVFRGSDEKVKLYLSTYLRPARPGLPSTPATPTFRSTPLNLDYLRDLQRLLGPLRRRRHVVAAESTAAA
jgi:hypothetical protein